MDSDLYNELFEYIAKGGTFGEAQAKERMVWKETKRNL